MPNNITVKDALSVNQVVKTVETAGVHVPVHQTDNGATEVTAAALLARTPVPLTTTAQSDTSAQPVRPAPQDVWTAGFSAVGSSVLDNRLTTPRVGTGVTYNQGAGSLNILSGTTANAEFLTRSVQSFRGSMRMRFTATLSQRIVNNNFAILLADLVSDNATYNIVNATTVDVTVTAHGFEATMVGQFLNLGGITGAAGIPGRYAIASVPDVNTIRFTVAAWPASGTGTLSLFGRNYVRNLFTGTTATNVAVDAQRNGWATGDTTATINTTASPGVVIANELTGRDVFFYDALRATTTTPTFAARASRYENIPDQSTELYVFIWVFNGSTAPASTTTLTLGHIAVESYPNNPVYIQGSRAQGAVNPLPVSLAAGAAAIGTVTLGAGAAAVGTIALGAGAANVGNTNLQLMTLVADVASAALTTTTTVAAITPAFGVSYQVNIPVTAVTGTNPTLDVRIEESDDTGTNWFTVYDFPRITATGIYRSPFLPTTGNRVRYVQTVGGTTPSFTRAVNRMQSNGSFPNSRQLIDRTVVPNTLNSVTPTLLTRDCGNATQIVVNMGAITTTAPQFQLEGSDDFGATWYAIGTPLTGVASSTVQVTVNSINSGAVRARVSTAGSGATLGYVLIKAHD